MMTDFVLSKCVSSCTKFKAKWAFEARMGNVHCLYVRAQILLGFRKFWTVRALEEIGRHADNFAKNGRFQVLKITDNNTS